MMARSRFARTLAAALLLALAPAGAEALQAIAIGGSFAAPTHVTVAPGQPQLLFVVERAGVIQVLQNEVKLSTPFLDISAIVRGKPDSAAGTEEGLLSVAFAPDYATSRRFYVAFTNLNGNVEIDEFFRSAGSAVRADPATRRVVLVIPHPTAANHNGGQLQFGPDGYLYISVGDGGNVQPIGDAARNIWSLLGKILRIRPLPVPGGPYTNPSNNPFRGRAGRDEIYAYGFRNPWRFSFDGFRIIIADVGQQRREEVNFIGLTAANGANFGWPQYEAELLFDPTRPGPHPPKFPLFKYDHSVGCAIVGGYVVRDSSLSGLVGRYIYGDACTGDVRTFVPNPGALDDRSTGVSLSGLSSFGLGFNGQLYAARITSLGGAVYRLEP
jgi:glucose/arabinose dehydrogenase